MDKALFEYYQTKNGDDRRTVSALLGIHPLTLGRRLKESSFSAKDISKLRDHWNLTDEECRKIFFAHN